MSASAGRIGPNAITQMAAALEAAIGSSLTRRLFTEAGLDAHLQAPPEAMVDERDVTALHRTMRRHIGLEPAEGIHHAAGRATGDYLLAHRIPLPAQRLLRILPARWSARLLAVAIRRSAWTFTGSGRLRIEWGSWPAFVLEDCPLCRGAREARPCCSYFAATFSRLYERLVSPDIVVHEIRCAAMGMPHCRFELSRCNEPGPAGGRGGNRRLTARRS